MKAVAPGKIILSGEHAVVYEKPALVMAVDRYAESTISNHADPGVNFELVDFDERRSLTIQALREIKGRLVRNYQLFLAGELGIRDVLAKPFHLFEFLFITFLDGVQLKLDSGVNIQLRSNIPIGSGMGSSAATLLSVLRGLTEYFSLKFTPEDLFNYGLEAEKLQHGRPSGVDPYVSLHGGFVRFQNKQAEKLDLPSLPFYLMNTGAPASTTGECVSRVAEQFGDSILWDDFEMVTNAMQAALIGNDVQEIRRSLRENHKLLTTIGVTPPAVQEIVADIEKRGGAAKIAGAGSISGDQAGMLLVASDESPERLSERYRLPIIKVKGDASGARIL